MPNNNQFEEEYNEQEDYEEIQESDYGFIIDENGDLKSIIFPDYLMEDPPRQIKKILKIFGIKNIHDVIEKTIH